MDQSTKNTFKFPFLNLWEEDNLSTKDTTTEFMLSPMHPLFVGFTVVQIKRIKGKWIESEPRWDRGGD